jgi:chemotaxis protein histidine kinase CheA
MAPGTPPPTVEAADGCLVIRPYNTLRHRAAVRAEDGQMIDLMAIERAERALEALSREFQGWMEAECQRLLAARDGHRTGAPGAIQMLYRVGHDLKGQAATFGFPLAARVAASLCTLLEEARPPTMIPADLIDQHVDAIVAMARAGEAADMALAKTLVTTLEEAVAESLRPT